MLLIVSCFSKIQIDLPFLVPAHLGSPGKRAVKRLCVCVLLLDVKMPLPEDSDLECFLPVHKALRSAAANTVVSDVLFTIAIM